MLADRLRLSHRQATSLFRVIEVVLRRITVAERPFGAFSEKKPQLFDTEARNGLLGADPGRNSVEKRVRDPVDLWRDLLVTKVRAGESDATINVVAHPAGEITPVRASIAATPPIGKP